MVSSGVPGFGEFFRAVHGVAPEPWLERLAERVVGDRRWPDEVVVPEGSGGVGCVDVAVWWLAVEAERGSEREAATRIWWVGEDGASGLTESAPFGRIGGRDALPPKGDALAWGRGLVQVLGEAGLELGNPALAVADRLRLVGGDGVPLEVVELGAGDVVPVDPGRPAVIVCSLDVYGSRLLFRGAGGAFDAGMAGVDSLVFVEGAGVGKRLAGLVEEVGECFPDALPLLPGARRGATVVGVVDSGSAGDGVRVPEVLPGLVWEWVKTTTPPEGEAPVGVYFSGIGGMREGPLEGRHSAFPGVPSGTRAAVGERKAPDGAREGRMPSLQGRAAVGVRNAPGGAREGRMPSLQGAAVGERKAPGGAREGRMPSLQRARLAEGIGLPASVCEVVGLAAELKGLGMGHEALAGRLVSAWLELRPEWGEAWERDLLVHLVVSHRGAGRPLVVPVRDGAAGVVRARIDGVDVEVSADLAETDWGQPGRFRRLNARFGGWGLGLLEAIVAFADEAADTGGDKPRPYEAPHDRADTGPRRGDPCGRPSGPMHTQVCDGIVGGWLNGWMAAVGAAVVGEGVRLHWDADFRAVLSCADGDPVERVVAGWPTEEELADLPIAERWRGVGELRRKVGLEAFVARARAARGHPRAWALSSTLTDLAVDAAGEVAHARFDAPGPGSIKWLHFRLLKAWKHVKAPSPERLRASLLGEAERVQDNGLGFDHSRLASSADDGGRWTDPVVEVLAFFALALLPMRARGTDRRIDPFAFVDQRQRGWRRTPGSRKARRFHWPAWHQPLDADGIDALLDVWQPEDQEQWPLAGVHAAWRTVAFQHDRFDYTRAFGSERLLGGEGILPSHAPQGAHGQPPESGGGRAYVNQSVTNSPE